MSNTQESSTMKICRNAVDNLLFRAQELYAGSQIYPDNEAFRYAVSSTLKRVQNELDAYIQQLDSGSADHSHLRALSGQDLKALQRAAVAVKQNRSSQNIRVLFKQALNIAMLCEDMLKGQKKSAKIAAI